MLPPTLRVLGAVSDVPAPAWDGLLGPFPVPTLRHAWLHALEASGSASEQTGWVPCHVTLWRDGQLVAAAPAYEKHHSMGEYIYDFAWAEASHRMGVPYYPKLLVGAPLSPLTAPRLLVAPGEDVADLRQRVLEALLQLAAERRCSSVHVLFPPEDEVAFLESTGLARRATLQYHWKNPGYGSWEAFLSRFTSKRRHQLRRERAAAEGQGIRITTRRGAEVDPARHAALCFQLYASTVEKNGWGQLQLNRGFFERLLAAMPESVEVVEATRADGTVVGGAFNLTAGDRLWGRYWGCFEEVPFLHFNVCMYHSVDDCIRLGRRVFEPGAGGEHKVARGFQPTAVHSAHLLFNERLDRAVRDFLRRERQEVEAVAADGEAVSGMRPWTGTGTPD
ncbi:MAG: N-acetyltransferase [Deltaproteobacteria bacterium]|nr:N-acetyltransferase [Deltaproteobacteria bacterium]